MDNEESPEIKEYQITREKLIDYFDMLFLQFQKLRKENLELKLIIKTLQKDLENIY